MIESIITKTGTRMRRAENGTGASSLAFGLILTATFGTLMGTMLGGSADAGAPIATLNVDGGASKNDFLMQFQADLLGCELRRPQNIETTSLGAAYLAGLAVGFWSGTDELRQLRTTDDIFMRKMSEEKVEEYLAGWKEAVRRTL